MQKSKQRPKKKARLQFYNITNRTTPKRRRRKHPTTKEVSSFSQVFSLNKKKKEEEEDSKGAKTDCDPNKQLLQSSN